MKDISIEVAFAEVWKADQILSQWPICTTRLPLSANGGAIFPYAHLDCKIKPGTRVFDAGSQITNYLVAITFYAGENSVANTTTLAQAVDRMEKVYNFAVGLPIVDDCYVLSVLPFEEDCELDVADFYGADVREAIVKWKVHLNEYHAPNTTNV